MDAAYKTDKGKRRAHNEDFLLADKDKGIFLLADGLGGHQAGEVASALAVKETYAYLKDRIKLTSNISALSSLLTEAVLRAHKIINEKSRTDLRLTGMGTTLLILVIKDDNAHICHVGDSRAYILREPIKQITTDHTVEGYFAAWSVITGIQFPTERSHILAQAVGISRDIFPETHHIKLQAGDIMLLCSDGLTDMLSDEEIEAVIRSYDEINNAATALIEEANNKGGRDNISVVLVKI